MASGSYEWEIFLIFDLKNIFFFTFAKNPGFMVFEYPSSVPMHFLNFSSIFLFLIIKSPSTAIVSVIYLFGL